MRSEPVLSITHVERVPASDSMGILRVEASWRGEPAGMPLRLVTGELVVEQLPQPPAGDDDVVRAAFPLPIDTMDTRAGEWEMEDADGRPVDVAWPSHELVAKAPLPDVAANVAAAATEALVAKETEIEELRAELSELRALVASADEKIDAAQQASAAMSRRLREAEADAGDVAGVRARMAELEGALADQHDLRQAAENELGETLEKLATALERVRAAEGAIVASREEMARVGQELQAARVAAPAEHEVRERDARVAELERELASRDAREAAELDALASMEDELNAARAEAEAARAEVETARAEAEAARAEAGDARDAAPADDERVEAELAARAEAERSQAEVVALRAELEAVRGAGDERVAELQAALAEHEATAAGLRESIASLDADLEAARATGTEDDELIQAQGSLKLAEERRAVLEEEVSELRAAVERLEGERDAARASGGDSDAEAALVNERERANGLERLLADRDRGERHLHERIMELEGELRAVTARATSMEAELAGMSDIRAERTTPIVAVEGEDELGPARPLRPTGSSPEDFGERLARANKAIQGIHDR